MVKKACCSKTKCVCNKKKKTKRASAPKQQQTQTQQWRKINQFYPPIIYPQMPNQHDLFKEIQDVKNQIGALNITGKKENNANLLDRYVKEQKSLVGGESFRTPSVDTHPLPRPKHYNFITDSDIERESPAAKVNKPKTKETQQPRNPVPTGLRPGAQTRQATRQTQMQKMADEMDQATRQARNEMGRNSKSLSDVARNTRFER